MKKFSWNQFNDFWRNGRLTITAIIFPIIGFLIAFYWVCKPFRNWVDEKLTKLFTKKKKDKTEGEFKEL